ncbi:uncharacterized protein A1O5_09516 [Cladophialophora psammophila CBS 110553]|uniref:Heterokaryon incompatibility domain-containing protein n=1 Tax=Cladophialophora psammophila CBS 110553 TaxID=1182543 RepID=W9WHX1_9EURO|nr:uncharacterized protein A1O5_09516 [Cladophialophora psammophila CBS 110553]EXJ67503.1 hypothetical protein A1O5_09516 [Cladophialophora psammophila CBS 110553]
MAAPTVTCRYCYSTNACKHCGNLEFYELQNRPRTRGWFDNKEKPARQKLNFRDLQDNARNCEFCAILYDGVAAVDWTRRRGLLQTLEYELGETLVLVNGNEVYENDYGLSPRLEFFTLEGKVTPTAIGRGRVVPGFFTQETKGQIDAWLRDARVETTLPRRLLDVWAFSQPKDHDSASSTQQDVRLIETRPDQKGTYVALSHCWVGREVLTTTSQNLPGRLSRIPYEELSPILRDAVRVCRFLNVRYLWIDSLCIIQGDQDDWEIQAAKMADIYENSFFTIAVQVDYEQGFIPRPELHEIRPRTATEAAIYVRELRVPGFLNQTGVFFEREGDNPPYIHARGWCYQERFLSRRILHFTGTEVMYEAGKVVQCQCGNHYAALQGKFGNPESTIHGWKTIVAEYTQHALTQQWDLLPGLAGIAKRFQSRHNPGDYVAGLWRNQLVHWLCWKSVAQYTFSNMRGYCEDCRPWPRRLTAKPEALSDNVVVPSFSWAARSGPCLFINCIWRMDYQQMATVLDTSIVVDQRNPFGRLRQCSLVLNGFCQRFYIYSTIEKDRQYVNGCNRVFVYVCDEVLHLDICTAIADGNVKWFDLVAEQGVRFWLDACDDIPMDGTEAIVLQMFQSRKDHIGIVLLQKSSEEGSFRRIGLVFLDHDRFAGRYDTIILE